MFSLSASPAVLEEGSGRHSSPNKVKRGICRYNQARGTGASCNWQFAPFWDRGQAGTKTMPASSMFINDTPNQHSGSVGGPLFNGTD
jgi:hypothetical protein